MIFHFLFKTSFSLKTLINRYLKSHILNLSIVINSKKLDYLNSLLIRNAPFTSSIELTIRFFKFIFSRSDIKKRFLTFTSILFFTITSYNFFYIELSDFRFSFFLFFFFTSSITIYYLFILFLLNISFNTRLLNYINVFKIKIIEISDLQSNAIFYNDKKKFKSDTILYRTTLLSFFRLFTCCFFCYLFLIHVLKCF